MVRRNWRDVESESITFEECAYRLYDSAKKKANYRGLYFDLKYHDVLNRIKGGRCEATGIPFDMRLKPYNGTDLPFRASLDRVDNTQGYIPNNIQVVCKIYNHAKWTWNKEDIVKLAKGVLNNGSRKK